MNVSKKKLKNTKPIRFRKVCMDCFNFLFKHCGPLSFSKEVYKIILIGF